MEMIELSICVIYDGEGANANALGRYLIHINDKIRKTKKKLTLFSPKSYFQNRSVTLNEHQALAINEYELAKLERNRNKVKSITVL